MFYVSVVHCIYLMLYAFSSYFFTFSFLFEITQSTLLDVIFAVFPVTEQLNNISSVVFQIIAIFMKARLNRCLFPLQLVSYRSFYSLKFTLVKKGHVFPHIQTVVRVRVRGGLYSIQPSTIIESKAIFIQ